MNKMRKVTFTCDYEGFLDATNLNDNKESQQKWLNVVALINTKHHDSILDEINEAIAGLAFEHDN